MQAVDAYHSAVAPATQFLEQTLAVPGDVAPILALSGSIFVPLFFLTAWYASTFGFTGKTKWEMASSGEPSTLPQHVCVGKHMRIDRLGLDWGR